MVVTHAIYTNSTQSFRSRGKPMCLPTPGVPTGGHVGPPLQILRVSQNSQKINNEKVLVFYWFWGLKILINKLIINILWQMCSFLLYLTIRAWGRGYYEQENQSVFLSWIGARIHHGEQRQAKGNLGIRYP